MKNPAFQVNIQALHIERRGGDKMRSAKLYTEICHLLTDYDSGEHDVSIEDFYSLLVKIQNDLEYITACDYEIS